VSQRLVSKALKKGCLRLVAEGQKLTSFHYFREKKFKNLKIQPKGGGQFFLNVFKFVRKQLTTFGNFSYGSSIDFYCILSYNFSKNAPENLRWYRATIAAKNSDQPS
jgi:hypothetical protein